MEDNLSQMEKQNMRIKEEYQKCAYDMKDLIQKLQEAGNELERVGHERDEVKQSLDLAREECNEKEKLLKQTKEKSNNLFSRLDGVENIIKGNIFNTSWNLCTVGRRECKVPNFLNNSLITDNLNQERGSNIYSIEKKLDAAI